jgi:hypothetical protein
MKCRFPMRPPISESIWAKSETCQAQDVLPLKNALDNLAFFWHQSADRDRSGWFAVV